MGRRAAGERQRQGEEVSWSENADRLTHIAAEVSRLRNTLPPNAQRSLTTALYHLSAAVGEIHVSVASGTLEREGRDADKTFG